MREVSPNPWLVQPLRSPEGCRRGRSRSTSSRGRRSAYSNRSFPGARLLAIRRTDRRDGDSRGGARSGARGECTGGGWLASGSAGASEWQWADCQGTPMPTLTICSPIEHKSAPCRRENSPPHVTPSISSPLAALNPCRRRPGEAFGLGPPEELSVDGICPTVGQIAPSRPSAAPSYSRKPLDSSTRHGFESLLLHLTL